MGLLKLVLRGGENWGVIGCWEESIIFVNVLSCKNASLLYLLFLLSLGILYPALLCSHL